MVRYRPDKCLPKGSRAGGSRLQRGRVLDTIINNICLPRLGSCHDYPQEYLYLPHVRSYIELLREFEPVEKAAVAMPKSQVPKKGRSKAKAKVGTPANTANVA